MNVSAYALGFGDHADEERRTRARRLRGSRCSTCATVPAAMSLTQRFGKVGVGFGVFVPNADATYLRTRAAAGSGRCFPAVDFGVHIDSSEEEYFIGPSFGIQLGPGVDIGASLFVHYRTDLAVAAIDAAIEGDDGFAASVTSLLNFTIRSRWGCSQCSGVQLRPSNKWQLGFTLRFPSFRVYPDFADDSGRNVDVDGRTG